MAGLVVVLVGGLEAGIALHMLNNLLAFGVAIAFDQLDGTLTVSEASWWQLPVTVAQNGVYLVLVLLVARRWACATPRRRRSRRPQRRRCLAGPALRVAPDWWAPERLCIFDPRFARTVQQVSGRAASHGVWGNWQPDWFWSS